MAASKIKLNLLIETKGNKLLFAEAGKDFVDFLFSLFSLTVGTVVRLLKEKSLMGCLDKIYESLENLDETYMQPKQDKNSVLNPTSSICAPEIPLLLSQNEPDTLKFYTCDSETVAFRRHSSSTGHYYVSDSPNVLCPQCRRNLSREMSYISLGGAKTEAEGADGGFVKGTVTYTVMDNLEVKPTSRISIITLLNKFNLKDVGALEERTVDFGMEEGLKLLKASMECKNVLTSVFLSKEGGE